MRSCLASIFTTAERADKPDNLRPIERKTIRTEKRAAQIVCQRVIDGDGIAPRDDVRR
jgi:hypothetical protein